MSRAMGRWLRAVVCAAATLSAPAIALAQTDADALRRDLLAQAEQAREAGDHARAAELAGRAGTLRMTPSLALLLAQEHEQLGHLVTALDHARRCTADATSDAALRNRERLLGICRELTGVLTGRVGRITVRVPADLARATVRVGGRELPPAAWGVAVPVDPGEVVVRVSDEARHHAQTLTVRVGPGASVEVEADPPAVAAPPTAAPRPAVAQPERPPSGVRAPAEGPVRRGGAVGPWVVAGFGAAALVGAGVLWALHDGAMSDRDGACDAGGCDPSAVDADARMRGLTTATNVAIAVGSAAVAGGVVWWVLSRSGGREAEGGRPTAWMLPTGTGVLLGGVL